jgi:RimJ/RimL family protein N-acetyltransferase
MGSVAERLQRAELTLRRWRVADAPVVHGLVSGSIHHLAPWMPWAADGYTERDARAFVERAQEVWARGEEYDYAVVVPEVGIVGSCGLVAGTRCPEIGYWLAEPHCGRGIATRAADMLVEEAFRIGAEQVEIVHDAANTASGAVPRRLGFTEVERRPAPEPWTSGQEGTFVVWRRARV